jgi:ATP-binding cassette subfamily B protein/subfamily B ATP-binding cassette protein MsbA
MKTNNQRTNVFKRLISYTTTGRKWFILAFVLILLISFFELIQPRLIQMAIDEHISTLGDPWYETESADGAVAYQDKYYTAEAQSGKTPYYIHQDGEVFYFAENVENTNQAQIMAKHEVMAFRGAHYRSVVILASVYLMVVVLQFLATYGQVYLLNHIGQSVVYTVRKDLYSHLLHLPLSYFDTHPMGNLVTRMTNDTENLNEMFTSVIMNFLRDGVTLIGIVVMMFIMNVRLTLYVLALLPLIGFSSYMFRKVIRVVLLKERAIISKINTLLSENLSGMSTIQVFNREGRVYKEFDTENKANYKIGLQDVKITSLFRPGIELLKALGIAMLIFTGGRHYLSGLVSFGILYAFIDYIQRFFQPILRLAESYNVLQSALTSGERIFHLLDEESDIHQTKNPVPIQNFKGKIEFRNVWFAYVEEEWVLKDVSFTIEPGEFVAFVGATGAGKTSIINLVCRFYDIQKGAIFIDGVDIKDYDIYELRRHIGLVLQDVFLFTGTVADNIVLGKDEISREKVNAVVEMVNAQRFVQGLPQGMEEPVMERGATFSAGESQLLAFARTLVHSPDLLILDEATANIDTETELLIQDALKKASVNRTTIAIAHRLSTISHADNIIVMRQGKIVESGKEAELLAKNGYFKLLYDLQYNET